MLALPREEEPQIVVPMVDIMVSYPGASAREVESRVVKPLEKLINEVKGVEYIYSTSMPGQAMFIVRFYVNENEEASLVKLYHKLSSHPEALPPGASHAVDQAALDLRRADDGADGVEREILADGAQAHRQSGLVR